MKRKKDIILAAIICFMALTLAVLFMFNSLSGNSKYIKNFTAAEANAIEIEFSGFYGTPSSRMDSDIITFSDTLVNKAHGAVVAEYVGRETLDVKYEKFKQLAPIFGDVPEDYIYTPLDYTLLADFEEGEKYILLLYRTDLVYKSMAYYEVCQSLPYIEKGSFEDVYSYTFDPNLDYGTAAEPVCTAKFSNLSGGCELAGFIKYVADTYGYDRYKSLYYPNIFRGESLKTVTENSDYLLKVKVDSFNERVKSDVYDCTVTDILRRKYIVANKISIEAGKGSLEAGKEYIVAVCGKSANISSTYFMLAADNGIIPLDDEALVEEFYKYYNK